MFSCREFSPVRSCQTVVRQGGEQHEDRNVVLEAQLLLGSLAEGCGCLTTQSYDQSACKKFHTNWAVLIEGLL